MQQHFRIDGILLHCEEIAKLKSNIFGSKILWEEPQNLQQKFYACDRTHHLENFSAIPRIDRDNIIQNMLNFYILTFEDEFVDDDLVSISIHKIFVGFSI